MSIRREPAHIERKIRIELLRSRAAIERQTIAIQALNLKASLDPREQLMGFLPSSGSGWLSQISRVAVRYPYLLSASSSLLLSQIRNPRRWLLGGVVGLLVWGVSKQRQRRQEQPPLS